MLIDDPEVEANIRELMALTGEDEETVVLAAVIEMLQRIRAESRLAVKPPKTPLRD